MPVFLAERLGWSFAELGGFVALWVIGYGIVQSVSPVILACSEGDQVAMNAGFYYMSNAGGRLAGTLLSGLLFQLAGVAGWLSGWVVSAVVAGVISLTLPRPILQPTCPLSPVRRTRRLRHRVCALA